MRITQVGRVKYGGGDVVVMVMVAAVMEEQGKRKGDNGREN